MICQSRILSIKKTNSMFDLEFNLIIIICMKNKKSNLEIKLPRREIAEFCKRHHILTLSVFGSYLRGDFGPGSNIDILVEFDSKHIPGLIRLAGMELELSQILGRKVDIRTPQDLSRYFKNEVVKAAKVQYAEGR